MLRPRVIVSLQILDDSLVKTVSHRSPQYLGDPINAVRIFNEKEADELCIIDIGHSTTQQEPNYVLLEEIADECFMPLTYGGRIRTIEQAKTIFSLGFEKISLHSAFIHDHSFVRRLITQFGRQSIVCHLDIVPSFRHRWKPYDSVAKKKLRKTLAHTLADVMALQPGELILHSVVREGTFYGPDLELLKLVTSQSTIPVVWSGGLRSLEDIRSVLQAGASAASVGSFFVYYGSHRAVLISYPTQSDFDFISLGMQSQ